MKALLLDDHPLILSAMQSLVQGLGPHMQADAVETPAELRAYLAKHDDVDILLLDLRLDGADGFDLLAELRLSHPALPVVIVSASENPADVSRALDQGAVGYVPKRGNNEMLFDALYTVMSGSRYVPEQDDLKTSPGAASPSRPARLDTLVPPPRGRIGSASPTSTQTSGPSHGAPAYGAGRPDTDEVFRSLGMTSRQIEVLRLLLQGLPNKMIARELSLSVETVKDHVAAVLRALGVNSRTQAVLTVNQKLLRDDDIDNDGPA
ncbi:MAG: hypothetical protein RIQ60_3141 [Pseudomonadota bacterium]|jgi:DNA-binding NarL/FixJ family response regulator